MTAAAPRVLLIGKPGCHLCDDARMVVASVCAEVGTAFAERSILDDPSLYDEYWERIPVLLVDGRVAAFWRVDAEEFRGLLSA